MDINSQLQPIIAGMINDLKVQINHELRQQLSGEIVKSLAATELTSIIQQAVKNQVEARLEKFDFAGTGQQELKIAFKQITDTVNKNLAAATNKQITEFVNQKLAQINIQDSIAAVVQTALGENLKGTTFPAGSIHHSSVNFAGFQITGSAIKGGIIENFGSVGVEDRASHVQMTIMDHAVAFENPVYSPELNVTGNLTVNGQVVLYGGLDSDSPGFKQLVNKTSDAVREDLNDELFSGFSDTVFNQIKNQGIDLDKVSQGGREIVSGNRLGYHIVDTNIQRVGILNDLQTSGENLLCDTLYVTARRVGINTMEPTNTLSIWDQEVEFSVTKHSQDTGYIGTPRNQKLVLGSNNKQNLVLNPDGTVKVEHLDIGPIAMTSHNVIPNYPSRAGHIVWNTAPAEGGVIGWVCLGGAQWAGFGKIENH